MLKVGELEEYLAKRQEGTISAKLEEFSVDAEATELRVKTGFEQSTAFALDETANHALAVFLKVPPNYFKKITPDFRATLLEYEFDRHKDVAAVVESISGKAVAIHEPTTSMLPLARVGAVITKVMDDDDWVRRIALDDKRFHLDVTTSHQSYSFLDEAKQVDDITEAGIRLLSYPFQSKKPSLGAYLERLVCTNGMCTEEKFGAISLQGRTVDEIIVSMEAAAEAVLGSLDKRLEDYAATRQMIVPGTPQAFAQQLAREANLGRKVLDKVLDIINQLPEPVTVWDVNQAFTSVANTVETYGTMVSLQTLGGSLAMDAEEMVKRCKTCEQRVH